MRCPNCGFDHLTSMRFCGRCGSTLNLRCGHCGVENPSGFAFCGQCSVPLTGALPPTSHAAYSPTHPAENILHPETALEGERKQVTVLFADLKGSLELLADRGAEKARYLFDPILACMVDAVHHTLTHLSGPGPFAATTLRADLVLPRTLSTSIGKPRGSHITRELLMPRDAVASRRSKSHGPKILHGREC
jgi:hypothetical protein